MGDVTDSGGSLRTWTDSGGEAMGESEGGEMVPQGELVSAELGSHRKQPRDRTVAA